MHLRCRASYGGVDSRALKRSYFWDPPRVPVGTEAVCVAGFGIVRAVHSVLTATGAYHHSFWGVAHNAVELISV